MVDPPRLPPPPLPQMPNMRVRSFPGSSTASIFYGVGVMLRPGWSQSTWLVSCVWKFCEPNGLRASARLSLHACPAPCVRHACLGHATMWLGTTEQVLW